MTPNEQQDEGVNDNAPEREASLKDIQEIKQLLEEDLTNVRKQNTSKDETINRLQNIVYKYEKGFIPSIKEPLIKDLILFKDSLDKFRIMFVEASNVITKEISFLKDEIDDIFFSHGIETIHVEGDEYDRTIQVARKKIVTDNPKLNRKVAEVVKDGYRTDQKILRKQEVVIYIYED